VSKGGKKNREVQQAMSRLEDAVKELGEAAKGNFADRAAEVLEQTAAKLKSEQNQPDGDGFSTAGSGSMSHWQGSQATRPFRDLDKARLWGICAGTAPYLGLEIWVVRCIAVTCLVFMPQVIVPAYLVAYFVLESHSARDQQYGPNNPPSTRKARRLYKRKLRRMKAAERAQAKGDARAEAQAEKLEPSRRRRTKKRRDAVVPPPAPPARTVLRNVKGTLNEAELRLRRMEGHVTSGRYELQKELRRIDA